MSALVVIGGLALAVGGIALLAKSEQDSDREFWLIRGKRYYLTHQLTGPGWDASMYPGFCNFSQPGLSGQNTPENPMVATFTAEWCAPNEKFTVPDNLAIVEVVA